VFDKRLAVGAKQKNKSSKFLTGTAGLVRQRQGRRVSPKNLPKTKKSTTPSQQNARTG
jgi:hypothetical protein